MSEKPQIDIEALAELSHISLDDKERKTLEEEVSGILSFVEEIQKVEVGDKWRNNAGAHNIMREDMDSYDSGTYTEDLLSAAPKRNGNHVEVRQVLGHIKKGSSQ